jgi:hypothetical protein
MAVMAVPASLDAVSAARSSTVGADDLHRRWRVAGVFLLVVLNALDLITTDRFLDAGLAEGNPVADVLIQSGTAAPAKAAILLALAYSVWRRPPRIGTTCAMWGVVGIYFAVVSINTIALVTLT